MWRTVRIILLHMRTRQISATQSPSLTARPGRRSGLCLPSTGNPTGARRHHRARSLNASSTTNDQKTASRSSQVSALMNSTRPRHIYQTYFIIPFRFFPPSRCHRNMISIRRQSISVTAARDGYFVKPRRRSRRFRCLDKDSGETGMRRHENVGLEDVIDLSHE